MHTDRRKSVSITRHQLNLPEKDWKGLRSIGMEEKTILKDGEERKERRYYISSVKEDTELFSRAVRGHWSVESMNWHLDVTMS